MLTIQYKTHTRKLNVGADFFFSLKTGEQLPKADLVEKVKDVVHDFGRKSLYHVTLFLGQKKMVEFGPYEDQKPGVTEYEEKIDETVHLKELKKETKKFKFTTRILRNSNGVFVSTISK